MSMIRLETALHGLGINAQTIREGAPVATPPTAGIAAATTTKRGGVLKAAAFADVAAAPTQADFNTLLARLRTAGII